ncbi:hypothetical protein OSCT_3046 [Oscillochloris trichoides DG-6]|uniref:YD repeat-containing protein n=1 Tax=Oscillochloris trichoides DG-6 TaxID=765420 RepID=E1II94_9CHLR|nr:hypothetical protein OSCT_3046 [Oscillochloris trichoides DG-6]
MGRFLTPDSLIPDPRNGQAWNRYAYVINDPLNYTDPSGHIYVPIMARLMVVAMGGMFAAAGAEAWNQNNPDWNTLPQCGCEPVGDPHPLALTLGATPGAAFGLGSMMGLANDLRPRHVPRAGLGISQAQIDRLEGTIAKHGPYARPSVLAEKHLNELRTAGRVRVDVSPNWGLGGGTGSSMGTLHLKADGVLAVGTIMDIMFQYFGDQGLCLTQRQRFYRVLIAGGMGLGLGALGLVAGAGFVAAGVPGLAAAGLATAITVVVGVGNEAYIKPRVFRGLGLQQE